jgi:PAS domain S-box-containing protein
MRWLRTSKLPLQDQEGNVVGLAGMFSDITAERKAQEDLFRSRQMLQTVMDNIPINICWKDKNSVYLGCNRQFATTLGLSSPEWIIGKTDYDHDSAANAENYMKDDREVMDSDKPRINYEEPLPHPDGSVSWLRSNKIPLHNTAGEVNGVLVMFEDITPAKRYAEEREHLISDLKIANDQAVEAARLKSEFVATMSHELRTPLNAVIGFSGIILEGMAGTVDEVARGMINGIYSSSTSLLGLINEVLDLSRIEAGRMEIFNTEFNLGEKLSKWAEVVTPQLNQKQLALQVNNDPAMPKLLTGDAERIRQVVVNLLSNAVKFTEKGGIFLETKWQDAQGVEIRVRDTGIGIPPHALNLIFEDFRQVDSSQQRKYGGSGLGLSIVRKLCTLMGGTIKVQSELGAGSTFIVNLPLKVAQ